MNGKAPRGLCAQTEGRYGAAGLALGPPDLSGKSERLVNRAASL